MRRWRSPCCSACASAAPAILALSYANYSNRGPLLLWTKSLQLVLFLVLSIVLIPRLGPLGAAIALVSSDLIAQFGVLFVVIVGETLQAPDTARPVADRDDGRSSSRPAWPSALRSDICCREPESRISWSNARSGWLLRRCLPARWRARVFATD